MFTAFTLHADTLGNLILKLLQLRLLAFLGRRPYYLPTIVKRSPPKTLKPLVSVSGRSAPTDQMLSLSQVWPRWLPPSLVPGQEVWVQHQAGRWGLWLLPDPSVTCLPVIWAWEPAPNSHPLLRWVKFGALSRPVAGREEPPFHPRSCPWA